MVAGDREPPQCRASRPAKPTSASHAGHGDKEAEIAVDRMLGTLDFDGLLGRELASEVGEIQKG